MQRPPMRADYSGGALPFAQARASRTLRRIASRAVPALACRVRTPAMHHALSRLLAPASIALVGASARPGAIGRIVFENIRRGGFRGPVYAVNPHRRSVLDATA